MLMLLISEAKSTEGRRLNGKKGKAGWGQEEDKGKIKVSPRRGEGYESITGAASLSKLEDCWFLRV